uniref:Uncharacterized protein n=1 Tax=Arion vulgaris TaxID=1028688 RepID=A0A0B7ATY0_9EUPU
MITSNTNISILLSSKREIFINVTINVVKTNNEETHHSLCCPQRVSVCRGKVLASCSKKHLVCSLMEPPGYSFQLQSLCTDAEIFLCKKVTGAHIVTHRSAIMMSCQ